MTWYADHIFAEPQQSVISAFCAAAPLANSLFLVNHVEDHSWPRPELRHNLLPEGLLVVREVCNPNSHAAHWYGTNAVHWSEPESRVDVEVIHPADVFSDAGCEVSEEAYPSLALLRFLKSVSQSTHSNISFYHCAMWGGEVDEEFAWIFDGEDMVLARAIGNDEDVVEYHYANGKLVSQKINQVDVLTFTLKRHEVELHSGYFALHTRSFAWEKYKLRCGASQ